MKALKYDLSPCAFRGRIKDEHIENVIIDFSALGERIGKHCEGFIDWTSALWRWKRVISRGNKVWTFRENLFCCDGEDLMEIDGEMKFRDGKLASE